jgi:hypothetical protein
VRGGRSKTTHQLKLICVSELKNLRCQAGTSRWGGTRYLQFAFTEQGVAMLSSVLNSDRDIQVNIQKEKKAPYGKRPKNIGNN